MIISLAEAKAAREPHLSGPAMCLCCRHKWRAVAPVGTTEFECPSCGTHKGVFETTVVVGKMVFECNCGCDLFRISPDGPYCVNCATPAVGWFE